MNEKCDEIYKDLLKNLDTINEELTIPCVLFHKYFKTADADRIKTIEKDSVTTIKNHEEKLKRDEKQCFIFGNVSAGKSTFVNAFLNRNDFPCSKSHTTKCFVEIRRSSKSNSYCEAPSETFEVNDLKKKTDCAFKKSLPKGTIVKVYYNNDDCPILMDKTMIIDTPAIDTDEEIDECAKRYCTNADIIVLVVNSKTATNNTMSRFLKDSSSSFSNSNFFVIYNRWDEFDEESNREDKKIEMINDVLKLFKDNLNYSKEFKKERIFFISAKEQVELSNNKSSNDTEYRQLRRDEFKRLSEELKKEMNENDISRKYKIMKGFLEDQEELLRSIEWEMKIIHEKIPVMARSYTTTLNKWKKLEGEINKFLQETTEPIIDDFMKKAIIRVAQRPGEQEVLNELIKQTTKALYNDIKTKMEEISERIDDEMKFILKNIYVPFYLVNDPELDSENVKRVIDHSDELVGYSTLTTAAVLHLWREAIVNDIVQNSAVGAATVLTAGGILILFNFISPAATLYNSSKNIAEAINKVCADDVKQIKEPWNIFLSRIRGSYTNFITKPEEQIFNYFSYVKKEEKLKEINDKIIEIKQKIDHFEKEFVLNVVPENS